MRAIVLLAVLLFCSGRASAELPIERVRAILSEEPAEGSELISLADEFRTGEGVGVWKNECLAGYFYKRALDLAKYNSTGIELSQLNKAKSDYQRILEKQLSCVITFNISRTANTPLNQLVLVTDTASRVDTPVVAGTTPSNTSQGNQPLVTSQQPPVGTIVPRWNIGPVPQLPPPVDTGRPLDEAMIFSGGSPSTDPDTGEVTRYSGASGPIIVESQGGNCTPKWSQYAYMQQTMRDFALMSLYAYVGPEPLARAEEEVLDLKKRVGVAKPDIRFLLNMKLKAAEKHEIEIIEKIRTKASTVLSMGYVERPDLSSEFYANKRYSRAVLEAADFYFEIYERSGQLVVVFRGTSQGSGWLTDGKQILNVGVGKGLYEYADQLLVFLIKTKGIDPKTISVTGHSLGGGLAAYTHMRNNTAFAMTFNPAELGSGNNARIQQKDAAARVFNFLSYVPGAEVADLVNQGTFVAKEVLKQPMMELPDGFLYGSKYYLPIEVGKSEWKLAKYAAFGAGAVGVAPGGVLLSLVSAATLGMAADSEKVATAKARTIEGAAGFSAWNVIRHPVRSALFGGASAAVAYQKILPMEQLGWGIFRLHIMEPLALTTEALQNSPRQFICGVPITPASVKNQLKVQSRVKAFEKMVQQLQDAEKR